MAQGTVDQLNFEAIIVDSKFDNTIKTLNNLANGLNIRLSQILEHLGRDGAKSFDNLNNHLLKSRDLMSDFAKLTGVAFGAMGIRRFLGDLIRVTGEFEAQKMALGAMLQDADKADAIFKDLRADALKSPYTFQDLSKYAKQLTAFNIDADQLVETERRLADVAAGLDVDMGRIILAYGQVKAAGVLKGTELRQFTEAGVPLLQQLADQIERTEGKAISLSAVFQRISKKEIPFEMVEQAFKDMTSAGGQFYNMQGVLVETLKGKIGKLRDVWQQVLYDVGNSSNIFKDAVDLLTKVISKLNDMGGLIKTLVVGIGAYGAALAIAAVAQKVVFGIQAVAELSKMIKGVSELVSVTEKLAVAANFASAFAVALGALVALGYGLYKAYDKMNASQKRLTEAFIKFDAQADDEISKLDELKSRLEKAGKGTEEYNKAKEEIVQNYGKYYKGLEDEINAVGSLETAYNDLTIAVRESLRERQYQEFEKEEKKIWEDAVNTDLNTAKEHAYKKLDRSEAKKLIDALEGAINDPAQNLISFSKDYAELIGKAGRLMNRYVQRVFGTATRARNDYLRNTRAMIKEYGLEGSENDPDFIGPILSGLKGGDKKTKPTWPGGGNDKARKNREKELKAQIANLQKLRDTYEKLVNDPLVGKDNAASLMDRFYGETNLDFEGRIRGLTDELIRLNPELDEYVQGVHNAFGKDAADEYLKSLSELDSISDKISDYLSKSFEIDGEKVGFKISKALTDLLNENVKVDLNIDDIIKDFDKSRVAVRTNFLVANADKFKLEGLSEEQQQAAADAYWEEYKKNRIAELRAQAAMEKEYNKKNTEEIIKGFIPEVYKDLTRELDLTNWADKSLGELSNIINSLENIELPDYIKDAIKDPKLLDALREALKELAKADVSKADSEKWEKIGKSIQKAAKALKPVTDGLKSLANAMGDDWLAGLADHLDNLISTTGTFIDAMAKNDPLTAYTSAISYAINETMNLVSANIELKKSIRDASEEARRQSFADALSKGVNSIWGTNDLQAVNNAVKSLRELKSLASTDGAGGRKMNVSSQAKWWEYLLVPTAPFAWAKTFTSKSMSLSDMASGIGRDLYDQYGNLNADTLKAILETYTKLKDADKAWINKAIDNSKAYAAAMEQLNSTMESITGNIASSAADTIVDGWIEAKKAALDYTDILDDVAQSYSKMVIKSMIMDDVLNGDAVKALKSAFVSGDADAAMSLIEGKLQEIADLEPVFQQVLETFDPYFKREEQERTASSKAIASNFSQDTIDYWSGQLTLLVQYARWGDEQRETLINLVSSLGDMSFSDPNYTANVQTYLASIQNDTSAIRGDIYAMKLAIQNMNDKGVKML